MKITDNFRLKTRKAIISLGLSGTIIFPCIRNASAMGYYDFYDAINYKYIKKIDNHPLDSHYTDNLKLHQYYEEHLKQAKPDYLNNIDFSYDNDIDSIYYLMLRMTTNYLIGTNEGEMRESFNYQEQKAIYTKYHNQYINDVIRNQKFGKSKYINNRFCGFTINDENGKPKKINGKTVYYVPLTANYQYFKNIHYGDNGNTSDKDPSGYSFAVNKSSAYNNSSYFCYVYPNEAVRPILEDKLFEMMQKALGSSATTNEYACNVFSEDMAVSPTSGTYKAGTLTDAVSPVYPGDGNKSSDLRESIYHLLYKISQKSEYPPLSNSRGIGSYYKGLNSEALNLMESAMQYKNSYNDGQSVPDSFKATVFYIQDNMGKDFNGFIAYTMPNFDFTEKISKTDPNGNHLSGAKMQILQNSKVIDSWTSDDSDHIAHLKKGDYILHETQAPAGYQKAADIRFSVDEEGNLTINGEEENNVVMIDQSGSYLPVTGKYGNAETDAVGMAVMSVALISFARKKGKLRRKSENNKLIKNK